MKNILVKCWITTGKYEEDTNSSHTLKNTYAKRWQTVYFELKKSKIEGDTVLLLQSRKIQAWLLDHCSWTLFNTFCSQFGQFLRQFQTDSWDSMNKQNRSKATSVLDLFYYQFKHWKKTKDRADRLRRHQI